MIACGPCAIGYHHDCWEPTDEGLCHCTLDVVVEAASTPVVKDVPQDMEAKERGGQLKLASEVRDLQSTGRKRAAKLYPIPKEGEPGYPMVCEWRGLLQAGGGVIPITGCINGFAKHIHHGPDKNTLANSVGNVHRVCHDCHNRWHSINDKYYPDERPSGDTPFVPLSEYDLSPHFLERATKEQVAFSEAAWAMRNAPEFLHKLHEDFKLNVLTE